jgi:hypothetical protein
VCLDKRLVVSESGTCGLLREWRYGGERFRSLIFTQTPSVAWVESKAGSGEPFIPREAITKWFKNRLEGIARVRLEKFLIHLPLEMSTPTDIPKLSQDDEVPPPLFLPCAHLSLSSPTPLNSTQPPSGPMISTTPPPVKYSARSPSHLSRTGHSSLD